MNFTVLKSPDSLSVVDKMKSSVSLLFCLSLPMTSGEVTYDSAMSYLTDNLPTYDKVNMASLGFGTGGDDVDGLQDGVGKSNIIVLCSYI